jgi:hypothetical protein
MKKTSIVLCILTSLLFFSCNPQNNLITHEAYNDCIERNTCRENFVDICEELELLLVSQKVLMTCDANDYIAAIEKIYIGEFNGNDAIKKSLEQFEEEKDLELVAMYVDFTYCMYYFLVTRSNEINSTLHLQFDAIKNTGLNNLFDYSTAKNLVEYSTMNSDFNNIINRIPVLLSISCHLKGPD